MSRIQEIDEHIEEHEHEHFEDFSEGMLAHEYAGYAGGPDQGGAYQMDPTTQKTIFLAVTFVGSLFHLLLILLLIIIFSILNLSFIVKYMI